MFKCFPRIDPSSMHVGVDPKCFNVLKLRSAIRSCHQMPIGRNSKPSYNWWSNKNIRVGNIPFDEWSDSVFRLIDNDYWMRAKAALTSIISCSNGIARDLTLNGIYYTETQNDSPQACSSPTPPFRPITTIFSFNSTFI